MKYKGGRKAPKINLHLEKMTPALFLPMNTEAAVIWTWNSHRSVNMYLSSTFYAESTQKQSMNMHNIHNSIYYRDTLKVEATFSDMFHIRYKLSMCYF